MAYNAKSLSREGIGAASAEGVDGISTPYFYRTADTKAQIETAGYFNNARDRLKKGDVIRAVTSVGGAPVLSSHVVTSVPAAPGDVTIGGESQSNDVAGIAAGYKIARGVAAVTGSATVVTGLATVVAVVATAAADASLANGIEVTATIGDQAGSPAAGSVILKAWKPTASGDVTPIASAAEVSINWIAIGT